MTLGRDRGIIKIITIAQARRVCARVTLCAVVLSGCAMTIHNEPINGPLAVSRAELVDPRTEIPADNDDVLIELAFSGGGMRAAAFSYGALSEFNSTRVSLKRTSTSLLDRIDFVSGVSGGAITAAYFGLKGRTAFHEFRNSFLLRNAEESLATSVISPLNIYRAYEGGINDAEQFPRWLDNNLFHGATFRDLGTGHRPQVWINASDIYNRTPFVFNSTTFDAICSELSSYPIASAVAASAAMPVVFAPVVLKTYPDQCAAQVPGWVERAQNDRAAPPILKEFAAAVTRYRDGSVRYIKLLDGGLVDNYGLSGFTIARLSAETPYGPLTARKAIKIRRTLFLVVDGGRGVTGDWAQTVEGPTGADLVSAAADTTIDSSVRSSFTAFERAMSEWREKLVRWRCGLSPTKRSKYGAPAGWDCRDLKLYVGRVNFDQLGKQRALELSSIPTRFKLSREQIEKVITAGRDVVRSNPTFQAFVASL